MKKLLLILLCLTLLFSCTNNKQIENDLSKENIKGKVKQIVLTRFDAELKFGKPVKGDRLRRWIYKYNVIGNKMEVDYFTKSDDINYKRIFKYDEDRNLSENILYNSNGDLDEKVKYVYDEHKNLIEEIVYNSNGDLDEKVKYIYDEGKNLIEEIVYNSNEVLVEKYEYKYDSEGKKIFEKTNYVDWGYSDTHILKYDKYGNISQRQDTTSGLKFKYQYEYDSKKNWIMVRSYIEDEIRHIVERDIQYY